MKMRARLIAYGLRRVRGTRPQLRYRAFGRHGSDTGAHDPRGRGTFIVWHAHAASDGAGATFARAARPELYLGGALSGDRGRSAALQDPCT